MRGITLLYTLLACSTTVFADVNVCPDTENDEPLRHEDCNKFYICKFNRPVEYRCYGDLLFNLETLQCDSPRNVDCEGRYITHADDVASTDSTALEPSAAASKTVSRKKRFLPNGCPDTNIHWLLPHETNCSLFYYCVWGDLVLRECYPGTHFNKALQVCDWPQNAKCSSSLQTNSNPMTPGITTTTPTSLESITNKTTEETTSEPSNSESTTRQSSTPKIEFLPNGCPVNPHTHWLLPHETDCTMFYYCVWGDLVLRQCAPGTHFNSVLQVCDWPQNANCSTSLPTTPTTSTPVPSTPESATPEQTTPAPTTPEPATPVPLPIEPTTPEQTTPQPTTPEFLPNGCPVNPHIHWLLPHETDCSMFYYCVWGDLVLRQCAPGTHFNRVLQVCDWPLNANCSTVGPTTLIPSTPEPTSPEPATPEPTTPGPSTVDPITPEPTTPKTTTQELTTPKPTKPEFLPNGCPVNPHIHWLLPHETNCSLFYYCVWGDLVLRECATGTHFNSVLQVCDWPQNVNCSASLPTTPTPSTPKPTTTELETPEPTTPKPPSPEPTTPVPSTVDPITPEPTTPEPTTSKTTTQELTTPKPTKPDFLPNGCPVNPHIHWLLPHVTNCSLFYYCVWGDLVLRECATGTHFNSVLQVCDWPQNVNCSASLPTTPTPSTPKPTTTELETPKPTTPKPPSPEPTTPGPSTVDPITPEPTTPKTTTQELTTPKPTKPEFLPNGCPVNPHIHWLLPHETNCSLFYYCVWGDLVLRECATGTHFNSVLQVCDWPQNANCSASLPTTPTPSTPEPTTPGPTTPNPITPEPTTPEPTTPKTTTQEPTTPKPTKPEFLPNGCPVNPHIHWLLPHETNCSLFYYCVWGDLVLRECAPGTHFNSVLQVCDWPQNANCSTSLPTTPTTSTPVPSTPESATPEQTTPAPTTPEPATPVPIPIEPTTPEQTTPQPTTPEFLPNGCPINPHIHWLLPHETDCSMFYYCVWGDLVLRQCAPGTHFNRILQVCDWPHDAGCTPTLNKHVIGRRALLSL